MVIPNVVNLTDLSREFLAEEVDWKLRGQRFANQFPWHVRNIHVGVYAVFTTV